MFGTYHSMDKVGNYSTKVKIDKYHISSKGTRESQKFCNVFGNVRHKLAIPDAFDGVMKVMN